MPCTDGGPTREQLQEQREKDEEIARKVGNYNVMEATLCGVLNAYKSLRGTTNIEDKIADGTFIDKDVWINEIGVHPDWFVMWYAEHRRTDAKRKEKEIEDAFEKLVNSATIEDMEAILSSYKGTK